MSDNRELEKEVAVLANEVSHLAEDLKNEITAHVVTREELINMKGALSAVQLSLSNYQKKTDALFDDQKNVYRAALKIVLGLILAATLGYFGVTSIIKV